MTDINPTNSQSGSGGASVPARAPGGLGQHRVGRLLAGLQDSAPLASNSAETTEKFENELAVVRLGMAASLFLRAKNNTRPNRGTQPPSRDQLLRFG